MIQAILVLLTLQLFINISHGASANVKVTINIPTQPDAVRMYNYSEQSYEIVRSPSNLSRDEILDYLPQHNQKISGLLDLHISKGRTPYRALTFVYLYLKSNSRLATE